MRICWNTFGAKPVGIVTVMSLEFHKTVGSFAKIEHNWVVTFTSFIDWSISALLFSPMELWNWRFHGCCSSKVRFRPSPFMQLIGPCVDLFTPWILSFEPINFMPYPSSYAVLNFARLNFLGSIRDACLELGWLLARFMFYVECRFQRYLVCAIWLRIAHNRTWRWWSCWCSSQIWKKPVPWSFCHALHVQNVFPSKTGQSRADTSFSEAVRFGHGMWYLQECHCVT